MTDVRISGELESAIDKLPERPRKGFEKAKKMLASSPKRGQQVSRKHHPQPYVYYEHKLPALAAEKGIWILWRMNAASYWRVVYTFMSSGSKEAVFILDYLDHTEYNKIFGYD